MSAKRHARDREARGQKRSAWRATRRKSPSGNPEPGTILQATGYLWQPWEIAA